MLMYLITEAGVRFERAAVEFFEGDGIQNISVVLDGGILGVAQNVEVYIDDGAGIVIHYTISAQPNLLHKLFTTKIMQNMSGK